MFDNVNVRLDEILARIFHLTQLTLELDEQFESMHACTKRKSEDERKSEIFESLHNLIVDENTRFFAEIEHTIFGWKPTFRQCSL